MQTNKMPRSKNVEYANPVVNRRAKTGREDKRYKEDPNEVAESIRFNASVSSAYRDAIKGKSDKGGPAKKASPITQADLEEVDKRFQEHLAKKKKAKK